MSTKKALTRVLFWVGLALCFNIGVYIVEGQEKALEFFGGYVIEQSLSIDNLFLFLMVFSSFGIKPEHQKRVLNYGIAGAIILRLLFIVLGISVINKFHWVLYVFGFILIISGIKMAFQKDEGFNAEDNRTLKLLKKFIPVADHVDGKKFFLRQEGKLYATPLFAVLLVIESTDIIFAIDSIPAVFSVTTDPFIVYTSNIFAIMGLRSLYFLLEKLHEKFEYVKYGVATILTFTGIKLSVLMFDIHIPIGLSIGIVFGILLISIVASIAISSKRTAKSFPEK